ASGPAGAVVSRDLACRRSDPGGRNDVRADRRRCSLLAPSRALNALREFPKRTGLGGELADSPLGGGRLAGQAGLDRSLSREHVDDGAAFSGDRGLRVGQDALFGGDGGFVLTGEGEGVGAATLLGLIGRRQRARDNAGADGARLDPALGEGGGN